LLHNTTHVVICVFYVCGCLITFLSNIYIIISSFTFSFTYCFLLLWTIERNIIIIIIIIIIERKDLGGAMSKDCKDTLQTLNTVTKRECNAKWEQSICQMRSWAELSRSEKLRTNSSVFNWRLKDASEDNDVRDLDRLFHVLAEATGKARSPAVERRVTV